MKTTKFCKYNGNPVKSDGCQKTGSESISYKSPCGRLEDHCQILLLTLYQFK